MARIAAVTLFPWLAGLAIVVVLAFITASAGAAIVALARERRLRLAHPAARLIFFVAIAELALVILWVLVVRAE